MQQAQSGKRLFLFPRNAFFPAFALSLLKAAAVVLRPVERHDSIDRRASLDTVVLCPARDSGNADAVFFRHFFCSQNNTTFQIDYKNLKTIFRTAKTIPNTRRTIKSLKFT